MALLHPVGVRPQDKRKGDLTKHLAHKHDIGVEWHSCNQPGCDYKAKR